MVALNVGGDSPRLPPNPPTVATIYNLKFKYLALISWMLPFLAVAIGVTTTYTANFNDFVNFTYCDDVQTHFLSMSHIAGYYAPQNYVWMLLIVLHYPPRLFIGATLRKLYGASTTVRDSRFKRCLLHAVAWLHPIEALSLVLMSVMHVETIFAIHGFGFTAWGFAFFAYVICDTYLHYVSGWKNASTKTTITFWIKVCILILLFTTGAGVVWFYIRWRRFCSTLFYALFCCAEYAVIVLNLTYHVLVCIELPNVGLVVSADYSRLYDSSSPSPNSDTCSTASTNDSDHSARMQQQRQLAVDNCTKDTSLPLPQQFTDSDNITVISTENV